MFKSGTSIFLGLVIPALSLSAIANDKLNDRTGWYVGGSIGHTDSEVESSHNFNSSGSAYGAYGGYNFFDWFGVEMDLQVTDDLKENANLQDGSHVSSVYYAAFSVMPKLTWQINNTFGVFGKAGMAALSYTEESRMQTSSYRYDDTWSDLVPGYAVGAELSTAVGIKVRLAYTSISGSLDYDDDYWDDFEDVDARFKTVTLGIHYQF